MPPLQTVLIIASCLIAVARTQVTRTMFVTALLDEYDSAVTPTFDRDYATTVNVSLHVNGINSVNEQHMDFSVNMYLTQTWNDPRLVFSGLIDSEMLELDSKLISKFWVPDLYFVNEKSSDFHDVTVPNRLLHLYQDGTILYKTRITVTAYCEMALQNFPFDEQNCSLYIKSFGYSYHSLQLNWNGDTPLTYNKKLKMSQFTLNALRQRDCHEMSQDVVEADNNGFNSSGSNDTFDDNNTVHVITKPLFSCLAVDFLLHRSVGFYAIQIYVPSALIVVLSWVSFVLDIAAVPARISLGILTVLTMTNMKSIAVSSLPKVSYIKAIDVWMAACLAFVFASLLEFAIVNAFSRRIKLSVECSSPETEPLKKKDITTVTVSKPANFCRSDKAKDLDRLSLVVFPLCFLIFIGVYLLVYLA